MRPSIPRSSNFRIVDLADLLFVLFFFCSLSHEVIDTPLVQLPYCGSGGSAFCSALEVIDTPLVQQVSLAGGQCCVCGAAVDNEVSLSPMRAIERGCFLNCFLLAHAETWRGLDGFANIEVAPAAVRFRCASLPNAPAAPPGG